MGTMDQPACRKFRLGFVALAGEPRPIWQRSPRGSPTLRRAQWADGRHVLVLPGFMTTDFDAEWFRSVRR